MGNCPWQRARLPRRLSRVIPIQGAEAEAEAETISSGRLSLKRHSPASSSLDGSS